MKKNSEDDPCVGRLWYGMFERLHWYDVVRYCRREHLFRTYQVSQVCFPIKQLPYEIIEYAV